jgi:hypothetical protein
MPGRAALIRHNAVAEGRGRLRPLKGFLVAGALTGCLTLAGCGEKTPGEGQRSSLVQLGEQIFHDESLSAASGRMSCATWHDPTHAFAQSTHSGVSTGGAGLQTLTDGYQP